MTFPRLLESAYYNYKYDISRNGVGILSDATECTVTEELNGGYTLSMSYPVGGAHWLDIDVGMVIVCKPNDLSADQPFVIKKISKAMGGSIKVDAEHLSYNASGIMVSGFSASSAAEFSSGISRNAVDNNAAHGLRFQTEIDKAGSYDGANQPPRSMRSLLLDKKNSFVSIYGGELDYDGRYIYAVQKRGVDNGVTIRYGKNLIALTQNRNIRQSASSGYPYWYKKDKDTAEYVELPEKIIKYENVFERLKNGKKTELIDLSKEFDSAPSVDDLRSAAYAWIAENQQTQPKYTISLSFVELAKTTEYSEYAKLGLPGESVMLGDTLTVVNPEMEISAKLRVVKTVYDALAGRYKSVDVGDPIDTLADTIIKMRGQTT